MKVRLETYFLVFLVERTHFGTVLNSVVLLLSFLRLGLGWPAGEISATWRLWCQLSLSWHERWRQEVVADGFLETSNGYTSSIFMWMKGVRTACRGWKLNGIAWQNFVQLQSRLECYFIQKNVLWFVCLELEALDIYNLTWNEMIPHTV